MITWYTLNARTGRIEIVECYPSLEEAIKDMAVLAWEDPGNHALDYVTGESGDIVAVAMYGAELELFVTTFDGRRLTFEMPSEYKG